MDLKSKKFDNSTKKQIVNLCLMLNLCHGSIPRFISQRLFYVFQLWLTKMLYNKFDGILLFFLNFFLVSSFVLGNLCVPWFVKWFCNYWNKRKWEWWSTNTIIFSGFPTHFQHWIALISPLLRSIIRRF